ncbi:unnamed protein product [Discosporangium mesarthrocarpum]
MDRWLPLLELFSAKLRGFGAALLVGFVETLLLRASTLTSTFPPRAPARGRREGEEQTYDRGPSVCPIGSDIEPIGPPGGHCGGEAHRDGDGDNEEHFCWYVAAWVRHLLSWRWHSKCTREASCSHSPKRQRGGMNPESCNNAREDDRLARGGGDAAGMPTDGPVPLAILQKAEYPLSELLERCRASLAKMPRGDPLTPSSSGVASSDNRRHLTVDVNGGLLSSVQWVRKGLEAVCHTLSVDLTVEPRGVNASDEPGVKVDLTQGFSRRSEEGVEADVSGKAEETGQPPEDDAMKRGNTSKLGSGDRLGGGVRGQTLGLEDMERLLAQDGNVGDKHSDTGAEVGMAPRSPGEEAHISQACVTGEPEDNTAKKGGAGGDEAWALCKSWTPCAIGTMPGWSSVDLDLNFFM